MTGTRSNRMTRGPVVVLVALLVAGLLGGVPAGGADRRAGCDEQRPAVVHRPGGEVVEDAPGPRRIPCGTETGQYTGETTIGVTGDGTVWFSAADWEWALVRSRDEGATWERFDVPGPQAYPGCQGAVSGLTPRCDRSQQSMYNTVADAFLWVDPATSRILWAKTYGYATCSSMNMSGDDGASWEAVTSFACPGGDYEKIAGGPAPAGTPQPVGYPNVLYTCTNGPAPTFVVGPARVCYRSLDGGHTWDAAGAPVPSPDAVGCLHFQEAPAIAPDGVAYQPLSCASLMTDNPAGVVRVAISDDQMTTWRSVVVPDEGVGNSAGLIGGVSLAVDQAGTVYVSWPGADRRPYLSVSRDGGTTWDGPHMIGMPGVELAQPWPQLAAREPGHVVLAYYGHPEGGDGETLHGYLTESFTADSGDIVLHSAQLSDDDDPLYVPTDGGTLPRNDYLGVTIGPDGTPWTALVKLLGPEPDAEGFVQSTGFAGRLTWAQG
jgi:hypothetical protein